MKQHNFQRQTKLQAFQHSTNVMHILRAPCKLPCPAERFSVLRSAAAVALHGRGTVQNPKKKLIYLIKIYQLEIYWSRQPDLNRRPADYESAALPTELCRPARMRRKPGAAGAAPANWTLLCSRFVLYCQAHENVFSAANRFSAVFPQLLQGGKTAALPCPAFGQTSSRDCVGSSSARLSGLSCGNAA